MLDILEQHGTDVNKDEHVAADVGEIGVEYFKLGCLYAELKSRNLLDDYYFILEKMILELEPKMINRTSDKLQVS